MSSINYIMPAVPKAAWEGHVETRTGTTPPKAAEPSELDKLRDSVGSKFKAFAAVMGAASAPLPQTGDGSKILPEDKPSVIKGVEGALRDMSHLGIENIQTLL